MESGRSDGLGKLLPKSISEKRRLRKQMKSAASGTLRQKTSSLLSVGDSDGTSASTNMGDDDGDDRSFGSFESGPDPESSAAASKRSSRSFKSASRNASQSPSRPASVSQHPSLIGYLTTSSPVVQAAHFDPHSQSPSQSPAQPLAGNPRHSSPAAPTEPPADLSTIGPPTAARVAPPTLRSRLSRDADNKPLPPLTPPPNSDGSAPAIVNTPPTPTQDPFGSLNERASTWRIPSPVTSADGPSVSRGVNTHKRSSSASAAIGPSKLSSVTANPLTPPLEVNEPNNSSSTGFFSSMISAAQTAANNLSTNIQNSGISLGGGNKDRTTSKSPNAPHSLSTSQPENEPVPAANPVAQTNNTMDQKDSAVRTLGAGDLSLSQLGLEEPASSVASPSSARFADLDNTRARSESAPADAQTSNGEFLSEEAASRPRSLIEGANGDATPPQPQVEIEDKFGMDRAGSLRRAHRKRGSSVTTIGTGMNVGAPLAGVMSPVTQPAANVSSPKLTGFAIASKKRNRDFHSIFKSVPDDDYLIEDYSCALQREILAHGRLYVSEGHLCFSSNILGWTTTLVMSFDEIVSVEKRSTALLFKNGLMISTLHAKHVFASFTSRDATYDLIVNIWKLGHPTLTSTLNGVRLEGTGGDKTEKIDGEPSTLETETQVDSDSGEESEDEGDEFYDEEETEGGAGYDTAEAGGDGGPEKADARKASGMTTANGMPAGQSKDATSGPGAVDFPGPATHPPTECGDASSHYDKVVGDDVIPAPLGRVYNLMFGQPSAAFMTKFLTADQKCSDVQLDDKRGLNLENKSRTYTYIKPLYGAIGPKSTKCCITETVENLDFEKAANVTMSTQTPEVPSGNVFVVKTKYCLSWAENNSTRIQVNCTIEWSGKSWIKGPIEKAANEGQADYCKAIIASLRTAVSSRSRAGTGANGAARGKKKGKKSKSAQLTSGATAQAAPKNAAKSNWGLLEPVRPLVEPITDILQPLVTGNVMYGLLVGLLVTTWFGFGFAPSRNVSPYGPNTNIYEPDRLAAYEEMWRREDSELWEWLEERIGLERLNAEGNTGRKKAMSPRTAEEKLREERMDTREVEEAMRVTEEKLKVLQDAVGRSSKMAEGAGLSHSDGV
ncbi:hypothetical protein ACO1O0_004272 [Amphichorda felina]